MKYVILPGACVLLVLMLLFAGCTEPPVKDPVVTVSDIALSDVSLRTMTVNTTVNIWNPNSIGARLSRVTFDVYYLDGGRKYLGHGETSNIEVKESGNTTVLIPVSIDTIQAVSAVGSLLQKGSLTLNVNGSAFIDVKVTSFEKRFEQNREFKADEFTGLLPATTIPGTGIAVSDILETGIRAMDIPVTSIPPSGQIEPKETVYVEV
ncbi:MAG TPA: LEA type 2 family protein [Methanoregula sp.]|nr:LEA type 2 family protein [Methanoregula sp.]